MSGKVILFEPDLLFSSRIESAGRKAGLDMKVVVTVDQLQDAVSESGPEVLLANLDALGGDGKALTWLLQRKCRLIGYYSHVDSKLAKEALANGFDTVITRRAFVDRLDEIFANASSS